jgi:hypothetical protein
VREFCVNELCTVLHGTANWVHAGAIGLLGAALKKSPACAGLRPLANRKLLASAGGLHFPHIIVVRVADLGERVTERIIRQRRIDFAAGRH